MMRFLLSVLAIIPAAVVAYILGAITSSQFVINAYNVPVSFSERLSSAIFDVKGTTLYFMIILIGFVIAFAIAAVLKRVLPRLSGIAYPLAGAVAIGTALGLMYVQFETVPISGARSTAGFVAQMICGALGGWVYAKCLKKISN